MLISVSAKITRVYWDAGSPEASYELQIDTKDGRVILPCVNRISLQEGVTGFVDQPTGVATRVNPKRLRRASNKQEKRMAESLGGQRQAGSGALPGKKGDGRVPGRFRIENKFTTHESYPVKLSDLRKIRSECSPGEEPVFQVDFKEKSTLKNVDSWALVPWSTWERAAREKTDIDK